MPLLMGLKGGLQRIKNCFGTLQKRIYPKKGKIWNNQREEKSSFILDFPSPYNLKAQKAFREKGFQERKLSALSHRTEFLLCAKSPGNKKPEKVKFPRSRQLSPLASAASHPMNRAETICHPPENGILLKSYCTFRPIFAELYNKFKYFLFSRCYKLFYLYVLTYCFYH